MMGTHYKQIDSLSYLPPPTIVYGAFKQKLYEQINQADQDLTERDRHDTRRVRDIGAP